MRVERHKKEITFFGWVLVSGLLLIAAARADEPTYSAPVVGPQPPNSSNAQDILRRARGTLPAEQYDAFEKAMKRIETGNTTPAQPAGAPAPNRAGVPGEPVIDGGGIPSVITFGPPAPTPAQQSQQPDRAPAEVGPQPPPQPKVVNPPAPTPAQPQPKPAPKAAVVPPPYDPSFPSPDPVK